MKKFLALTIVALVVPSVALAAKPPAPGKSLDTHTSHSTAAPKVLYVLKGILTAYTAAPGEGTCPDHGGSVTIEVKRVNLHRAAFKSLTQPLSLTFCVSAATKIVVKDGGDLALGPNGDRGIVKVRYAKKFDPTDSAQLADFQATAVAKQVIDKKPVPSS